jgi:hypothetical protein
MNNHSLLKFITILILSLYNCNSLLIETDGVKQKYCFSKQITATDTIEISYIVSGETEEKIDMLFYDDQERLLFSRFGMSEGEYKDEAKMSGMFELCFKPTNNNVYYISFEFFTHYEKGHTLDMAKDENFHEMKKDVTDISFMFEELEKNIKFIVDRRNKHTMIINDILSSLRSITLFKIFIILLVSIMQIFLIQKFFSFKKVNIGNIYDGFSNPLGNL